MNSIRNNYSFCSTSSENKGLRNLSSERLRRNLSSITKRKLVRTNLFPQTIIQLESLNAQDQTILELEGIWTKIKNKTINNQESSSFFKDKTENQTKSKILKQCVPKSFISLNNVDKTSKNDSNRKADLKNIHESYSKINEKNTKSKSPLSYINSYLGKIIVGPSKENIDVNSKSPLIKSTIFFSNRKNG